MESPRILKTRNSNITYQIVKKCISSSTTIRPKRSKSKSKSKHKPLENIDAANKLAGNSPLPSPASSHEGLSVSNWESEDSDEELVEIPPQPQPNPDFNILDEYKDKLKDLAQTYQEIIDRNPSLEAQRTNPHPSCDSSSFSSSTSTLSSTSPKRNNRHSQEDISNANLLLLLHMIE
ncbi:hypothetical protein SBOR_7526 [Sclerotinia borealis F-4128]|uniref:Uncharacterized protein n=1 Tax=Sclerotinia borealis (strain F-4128) TaxID=1432307 RepID=W9CB33_SCLBF|nr:hypothetical protein SBOR_7526 [Sclerotinia borealis F-4128]